MSRIIAGLNGWSEAWTGLMGAILWQSMLVFGIIALVTLWLRRSSPTVRYWLWQIVAIKLLVMPFWAVAVPMPLLTGYTQPSRPAMEPPTGPALPMPNERMLPDRFQGSGQSLNGGGPEANPLLQEFRAVTWRSWLLLAWAAVVTLYVVRLFRQRRRLGRLLRQAHPANEKLMALVGELAEQLGLGRVPAVKLVDADCSLFLCGLRRPVLVVPAGLLTSLHHGQLRQVLLHELAHVKRLDLLWCWPVEVARMLYFFHPIVYWVGYRLRLERELACDQLAMSLTSRDPADYADTLVQVVDHASQPAAIKAQAAISTGLEGGASPPRQDGTRTRQS